MAINQPANFNFLPHYRGDGLSSFKIRLIENGVPIDLTGCSALMQLRESYLEKVAYEFSDSNGKLSIHNPLSGEIIINEISEWELKALTYQYDLQITDTTGFIRTYLKGEWSINQDISKKEG